MSAPAAGLFPLLITTYFKKQEEQMIIDIHNHLGLSQDGGCSKLEDIIENMATYKISKIALFAVDEEGYEPTYRKQNDKVLAARDQYPEKIIAFARIVPSAGRIAVQEFKRCCKRGAKGLKMKMSYGLDSKDAKCILDLIADRNDFPVIVHTAHDEHSQPLVWKPIIARYPRINFILAHGGKDRYLQCNELAAKYPNVYIDTSTLSYNRTRHTYAHVGAAKILFASDYPYSHPAIELKKIQLLVKSKRDLGLILYKNASRLLGL